MKVLVVMSVALVPFFGAAGFLFALFFALFLWGGDEATYGSSRKRFLARRQIDRSACVLLYCGWLGWSEVIMAASSWYYLTIGISSTWRDVTPTGPVRADYKGLLRGFTISYESDGKTRTLIIEPLGRKNARLVVKRLLKICPEAVVSGIEYEERAA